VITWTLKYNTYIGDNMDFGIQWYLILLPQHVSIVTSVLIFDIFPMRLSLIIMLSFFSNMTKQGIVDCEFTM